MSYSRAARPDDIVSRRLQPARNRVVKLIQMMLGYRLKHSLKLRQLKRFKQTIVHGLAGTRMEQIAGEAQTTKRMVVYYFKTKEQLYQAVLEHV